ncbi:hypothetical protein OTB20_14370 [Streptomyces sp. H27-H1]|uniref:hypothetical protein n=1 Tax=Streptomyces sp. H27-H1 TaxID=2996461 RepID=UPI0022717D86|nr:hypothetical protein [Streptomyces sp. H27-H1]MCY0927374.1 hypothetical protein [Streptomyces sp. H27-H1]
MATKKITITVPEELLESIRSRVDARGVSAWIAEAAARRDAGEKLGELADMLETEYGPYDDAAYEAVIDRIAAIDAWHDERRVQETTKAEQATEARADRSEQAA